MKLPLLLTIRHIYLRQFVLYLTLLLFGGLTLGYLRIHNIRAKKTRNQSKIGTNLEEKEKLWFSSVFFSSRFTTVII